MVGSHFSIPVVPIVILGPLEVDSTCISQSNPNAMSAELEQPSPQESNIRPHTYHMLVFVQFTVAAAGLVVEILAGRMLAPYVGMSLYTWTAVIAVVLAGFSAGHWVGGHIAERPTSVALRRTALAMALAALTTALTLLILRTLAAGVISHFSHAEIAILILATAIAFLPSFFAGIPSPVLARIAVALNVGREGAALGAIFAASSLGAIAGTLATGFIFIAWFGTQLTILIVVVTYVALAALLLLTAQPRRYGTITAFISVAAFLISLSTLALAKTCTAESRYYCIRVLDFSPQAGAEAKLMVLDHLGHGINVKDEPTRLITPYVALMDTVLTRRLGSTPASSFFIGGGAYTLPRAWKAAAPSAQITVAEIDPEVTKLARAQMWLPQQGIQVLHADARAALAGLGRSFQVIVGDAFTDIAVPPHLVTREFFALVQASLDPGGVYTMNVVDHLNKLGALLAVYATLESVFAHVEVFAEEGDLISGGRTTFVLFASEQPSGMNQIGDPQDESLRYVRLSPDKLRAQMSKTMAIVLTDDYAPIDRLVGIGEL